MNGDVRGDIEDARDQLVIVRWRPPIAGHHVHVMVYRAGRILSSASGATMDDTLRKVRERTANNGV